MHDDPSLFILGSFVVACSAKVPYLPRLGESLRAEAFTVEAGGKGLNLAVGAHRLGAKVDGLLAIGDDFFSHLAEPALTRAGLRPEMLRRYKATTGSGIGFTDAQGDNCLAVYPGANLLLAAQDVRAVADAVRRASLVLAQFEIGDGPILEAFTLARDSNARTILNPSPFRPIGRSVLQKTSILVVNGIEAAHIQAQHGLAPTSSRGHGEVPDYRDLADKLMAHGLETLIVTLGNKGALAHRRHAEVAHQPAFPVQAVDPLGAGDAFTAALAASLLEGRTLSESLKRGAAAGALVTRDLGVFNMLPTRDELEGFLSLSK